MLRILKDASMRYLQIFIHRGQVFCQTSDLAFYRHDEATREWYREDPKF